MNRKNTRILFSKFKFFYPESSLRESLMGFGIECGDGWYKILLRLCNKIQSELNKAPDVKKNFRVVQVKEKFASLRFYTQGGNDKINAAIDKAELESFQTCEKCGKRGDQEGCGGWVTTLCKRCRRDSDRKEALFRKKHKRTVKVRVETFWR